MEMKNTKMLNKSFELDIVIERIGMLRKQDETVYKCTDYLSQEYQTRQHNREEHPHHIYSSQPSDRSLGSTSYSTVSSRNSMTVAWRDKICEWYYTIVDYFNYDREIVFVCMKNLDRYSMKRALDPKTYQLAAMASLFIVIKVYEPSNSNRRIDVGSLRRLSQNVFSEESILLMETDMLKSLSWFIFPPTSLTFAKNLSSLLSSLMEEYDTLKVSPRAIHEVQELTRFLTELSVCDYSYVRHFSSTIGLASFLNAIELVAEKDVYCGQFSTDLMEAFVQRLFYLTGLNASSPEVQECRFQLRETYIQGGFYQGAQSEEDHHLDSNYPSSNQSSKNTDSEPAAVGCIPSPVCISSTTDL